MITVPQISLVPSDWAPTFALPDYRGKISMFYERTNDRLNPVLKLGA